MCGEQPFELCQCRLCLSGARIFQSQCIARKGVGRVLLQDFLQHRYATLINHKWTLRGFEGMLQDLSRQSQRFQEATGLGPAERIAFATGSYQGMISQVSEKLDSRINLPRSAGPASKLSIFVITRRRPGVPANRRTCASWGG